MNPQTNPDTPVMEAIEHLKESLATPGKLCGQCRKEHEDLLNWLRELLIMREFVRESQKAANSIYKLIGKP